MPVAAVTYPNFVAGTNVVAGEINQNFTDMVSFINTYCIQKDASKAFDAIPTLPASDPSSANQFTRKSYVDDMFQKKGDRVITVAQATGSVSLTSSSYVTLGNNLFTSTLIPAWAVTARVQLLASGFFISSNTIDVSMRISIGGQFGGAHATGLQVTNARNSIQLDAMVTVSSIANTSVNVLVQGKRDAGSATLTMDAGSAFVCEIRYFTS